MWYVIGYRVVEPLQNLLHKDVPFEFDDYQQLYHNHKIFISVCSTMELMHPFT